MADLDQAIHEFSQTAKSIRTVSKIQSLLKAKNEEFYKLQEEVIHLEEALHQNLESILDLTEVDLNASMPYLLSLEIPSTDQASFLIRSMSQMVWGKIKSGEWEPEPSIRRKLKKLTNQYAAYLPRQS